jgi:hypothetical protein
MTEVLDRRYVTLSHKWRVEGMPKLLKTNLIEMRRRTNEKDLPPVFRDALSVCRRLGIRCILIDALCLVQDDVEDCQKEISTMGRHLRKRLGQSWCYQRFRHPWKRTVLPVFAGVDRCFQCRHSARGSPREWYWLYKPSYSSTWHIKAHVSRMGPPRKDPQPWVHLLRQNFYLGMRRALGNKYIPAWRSARRIHRLGKAASIPNHESYQHHRFCVAHRAA